MAILLKRDSSMAATYVPNTFIDKYMTHADGEFVKIYLYLLRCMNSPDTPFSISGTADKFDHTEKDVRRALKYWEKMRLLRLEFDSRDELSGICLMDTASPDTQIPASGNPDTGHTKDSAIISLQEGVSVSCCTDAGNTDSCPVPGQEPFTYDSCETPHDDACDGTQQQKAVSCRTYSRSDSGTGITQSLTGSCGSLAVRDKDRPYAPQQSGSAYTAEPFLSTRPDGNRNSAMTAEQFLSVHPENGSLPAIQPGASYSGSDGTITAKTAAQPAGLSAQAPAPAIDRAELISRFSDDENVQELLYVAERYIGRQLTHNETGTILYWLDSLGFSQDLIDFLIEQCVAINRPSIQYMDKVALNWAKEGVHTLSEAKRTFAEHNHTVFAVRRAFGITDRSLADFEQDYLQTWTRTMGFSEEVIVLACQKTLRSTQKISFSYANSILESWQKQNVHTLAEIELLDAKHQKVQTRKYAALKKASIQGRTPRETALTKYNSFSQRTYDYEALERELLTR